MRATRACSGLKKRERVNMEQIVVVEEVEEAAVVKVEVKNAAAADNGDGKAQARANRAWAYLVGGNTAAERFICAKARWPCSISVDVLWSMTRSLPVCGQCSRWAAT